MTSRKLATIAAAGFIGVGLFLAAPSVAAAGPEDVTVQGKRFDPELQRKVSYADLDLVQKAGQSQLRKRIANTAYDLCTDLNGDGQARPCYGMAIASTQDQVSAAILRAQRISMGLPVGPPIVISMVIGSR